MPTRNKRISVLGLGKLGSCYAAFYASKGFHTIGYDINKTSVELINQGLPPVKEPGLKELLREHREKISATNDIGKIIRETDLTFIILPTPSRSNGLFSVGYVVSAAKAIGPHLRQKKAHHVFVLVSTVLPGDSQKYIIPALEKYSGKKHGYDFGYVYSPSLIAIGDTLRNLENPDFVFLGATDERSKNIVADIYKEIYKGIKPVEHSNIESAELAKISLNSYVTLKITFANILGELCSRLPYADVDEITGMLGKDRRIGSAYLRSGLGYGGPCFPRDNFAFAAMGRKLGIKTPLALLTHELNNKVWKKALALLLELSSKPKTKIGVLGVAYKPNTTLMEDSQGFFITKGLLAKKRKVFLYEPLGHHDAVKIFRNKVDYFNTLEEVTKKSDVIFVSNPDKLFLAIKELLKNETNKKVIVDPWGMFTKADWNKNIEYISPGRKK